MSHPPERLLDQVRDAIRLKHYSIRTEETYVAWIKRHVCSKTTVTRERWQKPRSRPSSLTCPSSARSAPRLRTKPSTR